ncbi:MAG: OmpW family protein [Gammaproteobacteria bacterium]
MKSLLLVVAGACLLSTGAYAGPNASREAGDWFVRVGGTYISPKSNNHPVVGVDEALSLTFNGTYMFTDNFGLELLAALPYKHDIDLNADGSKAGSTKHLPPTLTAQWHFNSGGPVIPYVGLGVNYTLFFDEGTTGALSGVRLGLDPSFGIAGQAGFDWLVGSNWFVNVDVRYISIEADAKLDGAGIGDVKINPWLFGINVGWTF